VGSNASLATKVHQEINCTPGRAGGAIIRVNAVTGAIEDEIGFHEGQVFGTASTIKLALMLEVLRLVDANSQLTLNTLINVGQPYGSTSTPLVPNQSYTLRLLMQTMIANSDNWATNRLVDCLANLIDQNGQVDNNCTNNQDGMAVFNQAMQDLGLTDTRWRRYMRGSGPSPNGSTAYQNGQDNTSTPQEMAALLQMIHNNDDGNGNALLSSTSYNFYWNTMGLDSLPPPPGDGISIKGFIDDHLLEAVGKNWPNFVDIDNKPGGNPWSGQVGDYAHKPQLGSHFQRADAGRLTLDTNGDGFLDSLVFYALFIDEGEMSTPQPPLAGRTFSCIGAHLVREYTGQTSGADLTDPSVVTPTCLSP